MIILLTALLGCKQYDSINEACAEDVPGGSSLEDTPQSVFSRSFALRQNCYRRYIGLSQAHVQSGVQYAVEQHAEYLALTEFDELVDGWGVEVNGPEYYGADAFTRLDAAGYDYDFDAYGLWEILWTLDDAEASGAEVVDAMMNAADWHEIILQFEPRAVAVAHGEDDDGTPFVYGNLVYDFPASEFKSWVTWPKDGQTGVSPYSQYGLGTTLSIVVGASDVETSYDAPNPYEIEIVRVPQLVGPEGLIPVTWTVPEQDPLTPLRYSAIGEPVRPLALGTTYTLDGEFRWSGGQKSFRNTFETSEDATAPDTTTALTRLAPLRLRHHAPPQ